MIVSENGKTKSGERKVIVRCDMNTSKKCKGEYSKLYKNVEKCRRNNDNKDRCIMCFNHDEKAGDKNFNFKYEKDEDFFSVIDSELKAYLLGWIAGDGCIKKDCLFFEIHEKDVEILELFKSSISPENKCFKRSGDKGINTICWKVCSVKIVNDLLKHLKLDNTGKKYDVICLPELQETLLWPFVRGLFDSDGCVVSPLAKNTSPTASICSFSDKMILDLSSLCDKNNIKYYINSGHHSIGFIGHNCLAFLNKVYSDANFILTRKEKLWKIWTTWKPGCGTEVRPRKIRTYYPPISEQHKEKIRESNRNRVRKPRET